MDELFRRKILLLDQHRTMRIATLRPDGWPQVTTVGYANDGFTIYFLCGPTAKKRRTWRATTACHWPSMTIPRR